LKKREFVTENDNVSIVKVLKNGIEVKLQRNALSVLEPPTGNEEDDELDHSSSSSDLIDKEPDFRMP